MNGNKLVDLTFNHRLDCVPLKLRAHALHVAVAKTLKEGRGGERRGAVLISFRAVG